MNWTVVTAVVEGPVDEAVVRRVGRELEINLDRVFGKNGKDRLLAALHGYNRAAAQSPWWVLVDLDAAPECAATMVQETCPQPSRHMKLRVAVRAVEAWLLADRGGIASHLRVPASAIPQDPEALPDPKRAVVDLARQSTSRLVREAVVPRSGSGRKVGPGYTASMIQFAERTWDPLTAASASDSLARCMSRLPEPT